MKHIDTYMPRIMLSLMVMAVALSAWHVGWFMQPIEGGYMATVFGLLLGAANLMCAYYVFDHSKAGKAWPLIGLSFFSIVSTILQHEYFGGHAQVTNDIAAWSLSIVAPSIEIILGGLVSKLATTERAYDDFVAGLRKRVAELEGNVQSAQADLETERASLRNLTARNAQLNERIDRLQAHPAQVAPQSPAQSIATEPIDASGITDAQVEIIRVIAGNPQLQQKEIADVTGKSATAISRQLKPLKDGGLVEFDGASWSIHPQVVAQLNGKLQVIQ